MKILGIISFAIAATIVSSRSNAANYYCIKPAINKAMDSCNEVLKSRGQIKSVCTLDGILVVDSKNNVFEVDTIVDKSSRLNFLVEMTLENGPCEVKAIKQIIK